MHSTTSSPAFALLQEFLFQRRDPKEADGLTLIPWQGGKALAWDATVTSTLADSYIHQSATTATNQRQQEKFQNMMIYFSLFYVSTCCAENSVSYQRVSHSFCGGFGPQNFRRLQWGTWGRIFVSAAVGHTALILARDSFTRNNMYCYSAS